MKTFKIENTKELKDFYLKNGFVVIKNILKKERIKQIKNQIFNHVAKRSKSNIRNINFIQGTKIINSSRDLKYLKSITNLKKNKVLKSLAENLISEEVNEYGLELFNKPAKVGLASPPHQDNMYWNFTGSGLTMWIALDGANKSNGAVYYYAKSHVPGKTLEHKPTYSAGSSQSIKNLKLLKKYSKITPVLKPGDALIHDSYVIHGSKKNNDKKNRTGLVLRFVAKSNKIDTNLRKKYKNNLDKQIELILR